MDKIKYSKTLTLDILPQQQIGTGEERKERTVPRSPGLLITVLFACLYYSQETARCEGCKSVRSSKMATFGDSESRGEVRRPT